MQARLQEHVDSGELLPWEPTLPGDSCRRTLFITKEINDEFDPESWHDPSLAHRYALLATDFDRFVTGETIPVGWEPYDKGDNAFMARVDPPEYGIWTIRSVAPKPGLRVFGGFYAQDCFIAITVRIRMQLGGRGDRKWNVAREAAIERWRGLLDPFPRMTGDKIHDFISEKTISV